MSEAGDRTPRWVEHTVSTDEAGRSVQEILTGVMQVSRRMIQKLTRSGGIRLNRRATFLQRRVRAGDVVAVRLSVVEEVGLTPVPMQLDVVHEDADVLVLNKPPFLLVHPVAPEHRSTLAHGIAYHFQRQGLNAKVRPVHRLDRDTSGLLLIAKTPFAHQFLDRQLREREVTRGYLAFVAGDLREERGRIDAPIARHPRHPHLRAVVSQGGERAITHFEVVERYPAATQVAVELETGRTHQIRVHFAHLGHALLGDGQYGGPEVAGLERQALHAARLSFVHPTTRARMRFEASLPADLQALRAKLLEG